MKNDFKFYNEIGRWTRFFGVAFVGILLDILFWLTLIGGGCYVIKYVFDL